MKKFTHLLALALLVMAALSPLALAGSKKGGHHASKPSHGVHHNNGHHNHHNGGNHNNIHHAKPVHHQGVHHAKIHHGTFHHGPKVVTNVHHAGTFAKVHGVKFSHGVYFNGLKQHHFTKRVWIGKFGAWGWFDPGSNGWYYWHATKAVYYPVSYIRTAPPIVATQTTAVVVPGGEQLPLAAGNEVPVIPD